ncbi:uncharacterized protein LOC127811584 isoform X2 [Diospyros lotus]|uniref:uncharacterized protein LOC127811584 isoform X2 n=1 Tax=Diospyros lotus TaxID=55363 RepID=UPI00224FDD72|nr:uncharacterized protein LOC127811584 isoform X2 [Diospyros lotus]
MVLIGGPTCHPTGVKRLLTGQRALFIGFFLVLDQSSFKESRTLQIYLRRRATLLQQAQYTHHFTTSDSYNIDYAKILAVKMVHVENIVANFLPPSNSASNNRSPPKAGTA